MLQLLIEICKENLEKHIDDKTTRDEHKKTDYKVSGSLNKNGDTKSDEQVLRT